MPLSVRRALLGSHLAIPTQHKASGTGREDGTDPTNPATPGNKRSDEKGGRGTWHVLRVSTFSSSFFFCWLG